MPATVMVILVCFSNTDDHLRNHGFMLENNGWSLSPAYDINPVVTGGGLSLNISRGDNSQSFELVRSIAPVFRISDARTVEIINEVSSAVRNWLEFAKKLKIPSREINMMKNAFRVAGKD